MKNLKFEIKTIKDNAILLVMFLLKNFTLLTCEAIVQFAIQLDEKIGAMESKMTEVVSEEVSSEEAIEVEDFSEIVEEAMEVEDFSEVVEEVKTSKVKLKDKCIGLAKSAVKYAESFKDKCIEVYEDCKEDILKDIAAVGKKCAYLKKAGKEMFVGGYSKLTTSLESAVEKHRIKNDTLTNALITKNSTYGKIPKVELLSYNHGISVARLCTTDEIYLSCLVAGPYRFEYLKSIINSMVVVCGPKNFTSSRPTLDEKIKNPLVEVGSFEYGKFRTPKLSFVGSWLGRPTNPVSNTPTLDQKIQPRTYMGRRLNKLGHA